MRHCPFAYVMQKNAAAQQHHHHAMHGHSHGHGPGGTMPMPMLSPQEMAQRQAAFQADPQKRALMQVCHATCIFRTLFVTLSLLLSYSTSTAHVCFCFL
jgi:hypothetical protein